MSLQIHGRISRGDFSLAIDEQFLYGEVVAVVGPNGSGKSTLLHLVAGLLQLDDGELVLDNVLCDALGQGVYVAPELRNIGMVFQNLHLISHLSAVKNIELALQARKVPRKERATVALSLLARVQGEYLAHRLASQLSGGEAQRVALARAMACSPQVLLLDEPLSAIDAAAKNELREILAEVLREYMGVTLLVSHDPADAAALATRTITHGR